MPAIGIIGGSGFYSLLKSGVEYKKVETPYGDPSAEIAVGTFGGTEIAFLARHGRKHGILPSEINFRANIWALASLGVSRVISVSAVGSMKEELMPGDIVIPDNFIDFTKSRAKTFYGSGVVGHLSLAHPVCPEMSGAFAAKASELAYRAHSGGTYICIEGPNFSTYAESMMFRSWGVDIIGMTNVPEVNLCREAGMCYSTIACVTDYDCWKEGEEDASIEAIIKILAATIGRATTVIEGTAAALAGGRNCGCFDISKSALMTPPADIPPETIRKLGPVFGGFIAQ